ncbi:MAG TPA: hypothetical protein VKR43_07235 [Bryobacteraceae bacterium]|nr:hypothetical protein [Bryobacteraceae bacterium]
MLRSIIICPDQELAEHLHGALTATGVVAVGRTVNRYPDSVDLVRTLRAQTPEVIFLSFETLEQALALVRFVETEVKNLQIIAFHKTLDPKLLRESMRAGVREFLAEPFERHTLMEALGTAKELLDKNPVSYETTSQIFAFLPSKAGAGTSTIALNVSAAMSRRPDTRVMLSDFDLNSGMMRFMLKLQNEYSITDAIENAPRLDENLWPSLVTTIQGLDVLHAGRVNPSLRVEGTHIRAMIDFLRRVYQVLCFDLSGNLERYSMEIMQECKRVLLVCTPEIPSLHLAREKMAYLKHFDLDGRVSVVLNRYQKKAVFSKEQVEEILGIPVLRTFPNDYQGVNKAMTAGSFVETGTELGKAYKDFAAELLEPRGGASQPEGKRKFLDMFASVSSRGLASGEK